MKIIVGLGNPGREYESTRHNAGFMAIDRISSLLDIQVTKAKHKALTGNKMLSGEKLMLVKPMTFMNLSGDCVAEILKYYNLTMEDIIIIYDDESLSTGSVRVRESGSDGGHNGMKSIISRIGGQNFKRVRIGIGEKPPGWDLADYVLSRFTENEKAEISRAVNDAAECALLILKGDVKEAMNKFNRRVKSDELSKEGE